VKDIEKEKVILEKLKGASPKECAPLLKKLFKIKFKKGRKH